VRSWPDRPTLLLAFVLGGCASASPAPVVISNRVSVVVLPAPDELPFDPRDVRLAQATAQLTALAGHPITFEYDVALLPDWRAGFQDMLVSSVEDVARDLDRLRVREPPVFAHGAPLLGRIVARYDARAVGRAAHALDAGARVLMLTGPANGWAVERGIVEVALEEEYQRWADERWGEAAADAVAQGDRRAYFEFLTDYEVRSAWRKRHETTLKQKPERAPRSPDIAALRQVVRLAELVGSSDGALAADIRAWLLQQVGEFADAYNGEADLVLASAASSPWHRAEAAWVAWLNAHLGSLGDEEKTKLVQHVFVRARGSDGHQHAARWAFPGFDRFAFGLSIADQWLRTGRVSDGAMPASLRDLVGAIVCPRSVDERGVAFFAGRCDYVWYEDALDDATSTRRFLDALLARKDPRLVEAAFAAIDYMPSGDDKLATLFALARSLEGDETCWRAAFRVIADERAEGGDADRFMDEARRIWRSGPSRHGVLLYALAQVDRYGSHDKVGWDRFADLFGQSLGPQDFAAYLDEGVRAVSLAEVPWPALGRGWSRAAVVLPRLDAYLADARAKQYDSGDPSRAVGNLARKLCEEGNVADMAQLASYFERRLAGHPGESYAPAFEDTANCAKAPARSLPGKRRFL